MALISKNIKLSYEGTEGTFVELTDLLEIPSLGGTVESIETTTLADEARTYTKGLISYGDSLDFKFQMGDTSDQFFALNALKDAGAQKWMVTLPDQSACTFTGECSVALDGVGIAAVITYTLSIKPNSAMTWAE